VGFNDEVTYLWNDVVSWAQLEARFVDRGVRQVQVKYLSRNHNSKNQIAGLGSDLSAMGHLYPGPVTNHSAGSRKPKAGAPIYRSFLPWVWFSEHGLSPAPETKLIYYPQYPEIRLSGFLDGSPHAPNELLTANNVPGSRGQELGRILVFGPGEGRKVYAALVTADSPAAAFLERLRPAGGRMAQILLSDPQLSSKDLLFRELAQISRKEWIRSYRLRPDGSTEDCTGTNCHGVTLESELGITGNGRAAPDFLDWEVKAHIVAHLRSHLSSKITLLTPNPDSGTVKEKGTTWVTQTYGTHNVPAGRFDLAGVHKAGVPNSKTGLEFGLHGFDPVSEKITGDGFLYLRDPAAEDDVARWSFAKLLTHWQAKHAKTVFVPSVNNRLKPAKFSYGRHLYIGEGTSFLHFLKAVSDGVVALDPGLNTKLEAEVWKAHTRYQFRTSLTQASVLYRSFEKIHLDV
jgi:hypothetical protein